MGAEDQSSSTTHCQKVFQKDESPPQSKKKIALYTTAHQ
jgi:hypothetical protein